MTTTTTKPRPYISRDASFIVETAAGRIEIKPLERDRVMIDSAHSNSVPWHDERHETKGLTINGVVYSATGFVWLRGGEWTCEPPPKHVGDISISRRGQMIDGTPSAYRKAREIVTQAVSEWAKDHADDLAEADRIWRNNEARGAEKQLTLAERHVAELREIIAANDRGETRSQYETTCEPLHERR